MKRLIDILNESLNRNRFRNTLSKISHPFSKIHQLPYIAILNGNCCIPGCTIKENLKDVNDMIDNLIDYVRKNYYDRIENITFKELSKTNIYEATIIEMPDCDNKEVLDIFNDLSDVFIKEVDKLSKDYGEKKVKFKEYISRDNALVKECSVEIVLKDLNGEFQNYLYPEIKLVTYE